MVPEFTRNEPLFPFSARDRDKREERKGYESKRDGTKGQSDGVERDDPWFTGIRRMRRMEEM